MGMKSFDREDLHAPMADINTTPLVDVMLVLLVIFLVTAPMLSHAVKLELPRETTTEVKDQKAITLAIDAAGQYYWNDALVTDEVLIQNIQKEGATNALMPIHIRADTSAPYGKIGHVLAVAARAGMTNIGFITEPDQK